MILTLSSFRFLRMVDVLTGKVYGKLKLDARVYLMPKEVGIDAAVYIHLKGYARAKVTHLD